MLYRELRELSGASKGSGLVRSVQAVYRQKLVPAVVGRPMSTKGVLLLGAARLFCRLFARYALAGPACAPSWSLKGGPPGAHARTGCNRRPAILHTFAGDAA